MGTIFVGEIRMFAGNFAPAGWALCDGQLLSIAENDTLFTLIGTTYGGDGESTFAVPNLQSRVPVHQGTGTDGISYTIGAAGGTELVTLTAAQIPVHNHPLQAGGAADRLTPEGGTFARGAQRAYTAPPSDAMDTGMVGTAGGGQGHDNVQPFLCINFIISLFGVFPSPT